jgi:outer membrane protein OmpA-like peptidoglycan-associated protein
MIRRSLVVAVMSACALIATPVFAQDPTEPDADNCKPSPLLSRMPGCQIFQCEKKEFDQYELVINKASEKKTLEGAGDFLNFACPASTSQLQLQRNVEAALRKSGYTIVYSGKHEDHEFPIVTAQKGAQWIQVQTGNYNEFSTYEQTTVLVKEMAQDMSASAQAMSDAIAKSGRLDVYGITFATGQATITPQSNQVLGDVLAVLKANPEWKLRIEGHTDNVGDKAANLKLSQARAAAVAAWLTGQGIAAARLTTAGLGDTQPVADNATDDGKARNRRVVLIKQ